MTIKEALAHIRHLPWLLLGLKVSIINSLFCGKIIFAWLLEGEAVVIDDALVLNSFFVSRSIINGDIEHLAQ